MQEEDLHSAEYAAHAAAYSRHKVVKQQSIPKFSSSKKGGDLTISLKFVTV